MVFSATFNTISVISWRSVLLAEETGVPGENHRPVADKPGENHRPVTDKPGENHRPVADKLGENHRPVTDKLYHTMLYQMYLV